jgi:hypothetical protein
MKLKAGAVIAKKLSWENRYLFGLSPEPYYVWIAIADKKGWRGMNVSYIERSTTYAKNSRRDETEKRRRG